MEDASQAVDTRLCHEGLTTRMVHKLGFREIGGQACCLTRWEMIVLARGLRESRQVEVYQRVVFESPGSVNVAVYSQNGGWILRPCAT